MGSRTTDNQPPNLLDSGIDNPGDTHTAGEPQSHAQRLLQQLLARASRMGEQLWPVFLRRRAGAEQLVRGLPQRMHRTANQLSLALELADDYRAGTYREIPWTSIAIAIAGIIYVVSPFDLMPLPIPGLGAIDDVVVMGIVMRYLRADLLRYCAFKGYDPADYFD